MRKHYFKDDLLVVHHINEDGERKNEFFADRRYLMLFILHGSAKIMLDKDSFILKENQFIIVNVGVPFSYNFIEGTSADCIFIRFFPSLFNDLYDDKYFLRPFKSKDFTKQIFNLDSYEMRCIEYNVLTLKNCLYKMFGKTHLVPRISTIISELCFIYDKQFPHEHNSTDSTPTKIIDYINNHYLEKLSYEILMKKFGVSRPTLNAVLRKHTGQTLHEYITALRMIDAKDLMDANISSTKIAEMCGYSSYSTFYRTYKEYYNVTPNDDNTKNTYDKWPLA